MTTLTFNRHYKSLLYHTQYEECFDVPHKYALSAAGHDRVTAATNIYSKNEMNENGIQYKLPRR